ncbi:MAG: type II toxin-antitoxin system VapC family toxin [Chloroflexota bacterium]
MTTKFLVLDASFTNRAIMTGHDQELAEQQLVEWKKDGYRLIAPTLWYYETASTLCKMVRFGQYTQLEAEESLLLAKRLPLKLISPYDAQVELAIDWTYRLKRAAAYDSFYLALAELSNCDLWTADSKLFNAAQKPWIKLWKK